MQVLQTVLNRRIMSVSTSYSIVLFVVHLTIISGVHGQHTYWIASNTSQCGGRAPCQTLDSYIRYNASLLSASHTKWIFLQGKHYVNVYKYVNIRNTRNVTLTGEYPCTSSVNEQCSSTVLLPEVESKTLLIHICNVTDLVITNLMFLSHSVGYRGENSLGTLSLEHIHNLTIQAVVLHGLLLELAHPSGSVFISDLTTNHLKIEITNFIDKSPHSAECDTTSNEFNTCEQFWVNVTIFNSTFQFQVKKGMVMPNGIDISDTSVHRDEFGSVQCPNCSFITRVYFNHCVFRNSAVPLVVRFLTETHCSKVTISNCVFIHNRFFGVGMAIWLHGPHQMELENTEFLENDLYQVIKVDSLWQGKLNTSEEIDFSPNIIFNNCRFLNNSIRNTLMKIRFPHITYSHTYIHTSAWVFMVITALQTTKQAWGLHFILS